MGSLISKKIIILGSTGSIGLNTLSVIDSFPGSFEIKALSAYTNEKELLKQAAKYNVLNLALAGGKPVSPLIKYSGSGGIIDLIRETDADIVVNGIAGAMGLMPSITSLKTGKNLALANKETIVMAGRLVMNLAAGTGCRVIPVDSEHSAIFHLLSNKPLAEIDEIIITASGGAFRDTPAEKLKYVTLEDALKHPNWSMGNKITIDSASMANKGLEVIEAYQLFNIELSKIKVLIHPQSMVHSLIRTIDNSMYAQISSPDMRIPIQNALTFPEISKSIFGRLDLSEKVLEFRKPDILKYPMLPLAYRAAEQGQGSSIAYNAANESAVAAFTRKKINFIDIPAIVEKTLDRDWPAEIDYEEEILEIDKTAREVADKIMGDF